MQSKPKTRQNIFKKYNLNKETKANTGFASGGRKYKIQQQFFN